MSSKHALAQVLQTIAEDLQTKHGFSQEELIRIIQTETDTIPATAFAQGLTPLETLTLYFDDTQLEALNRPKHTIAAARTNAHKKLPEGLEITESKHNVPLRIFGHRELSPLENLCIYLKDQGLRNTDISKLIKKNPRTVWTAIHRAQQKRGEADE